MAPSHPQLTLKDRFIALLGQAGPPTVPVVLSGQERPIARLVVDAEAWSDGIVRYVQSTRGSELKAAAERLRMTPEDLAKRVFGEPTFFLIAFGVGGLSGELIERETARAIKGFNLSRTRLCARPTCGEAFQSDAKHKFYCSDDCENVVDQHNETLRSRERSQKRSQVRAGRRERKAEFNRLADVLISQAIDAGDASWASLLEKNHFLKATRTPAYRSRLQRLAVDLRNLRAAVQLRALIT